MPQALSVQAFLALRQLFFASDGLPNSLNLREKGATQDDPLDEYIAQSLRDMDSDVRCIKAPSLTTPDLVLMRPGLCQGVQQEILRFALERIIGIEVKKLGVTDNGKIVRATGLDYNSTPPSATIRVYDKARKPIDIRGFYLFLSEELARTSKDKKQTQITSIVLCDGALLNDDFQLYLDITKPRPMERNKGSYGEGGIRWRPMVVFPNPLSFEALFHHVTLIHTSSGLEKEYPSLKRIMIIERKGIAETVHRFYAYRLASDVSSETVELIVQDPFTKVRKEGQGQRGRLALDISIGKTTSGEASEDIDIEPGEPL